MMLCFLSQGPPKLRTQLTSLSLSCTSSTTLYWVEWSASSEESFWRKKKKRHLVSPGIPMKIEPGRRFRTWAIFTLMTTAPCALCELPSSILHIPQTNFNITSEILSGRYRLTWSSQRLVLVNPPASNNNTVPRGITKCDLFVFKCKKSLIYACVTIMAQQTSVYSARPASSNCYTCFDEPVRRYTYSCTA